MDLYLFRVMVPDGCKTLTGTFSCLSLISACRGIMCRWSGLHDLGSSKRVYKLEQPIAECNSPSIAMSTSQKHSFEQVCSYGAFQNMADSLCTSRIYQTLTTTLLEHQRGRQWPVYFVGVSVFVSTRIVSGALSLIEFLGRAQAVNLSVTV